MALCRELGERGKLMADDGDSAGVAENADTTGRLLRVGCEFTALRSQLTVMKISALSKRAVVEGIDIEQVEAAQDAPNPREALISLLLEAAPADPADDTDAITDASSAGELVKLKMSELRKRVVNAGIDPARTRSRRLGWDPSELL